MKILIISGFLGAGKTTFIRELSKQTGVDFAVMENEYGEAGIDGSVLAKDRLKVWELTEGCICCSLKSDFASSILTIANVANPEYLVVEPTGVGALSSIIANIQKIEYERIRLLEPLTIVDINNIDEYIETFGDLYIDQIKYASRIIISKTENKEKKIADAVQKLKKINPTAEIVSNHYSSQPKLWWNSILKADYNKSTQQNTSTFTSNLQSITIENLHFCKIEDLMKKLLILMHKPMGSIYRAKGFAKIENQWTKFDLVNQEYSIETSEPIAESKVVVIGENLKSEELKRFFTTDWCG